MLIDMTCWGRALMASLVVATGACSVSADLETAKTAAANFRNVMKAGDSAEAYAAADKAFRDSTPIELAQQLVDVYSRLEAICGPAPEEPASWLMSQSTSGNYTTLIYQRECETGQLVEKYVLHRDGDAIRVAGFHVNGPPVLALLASAATREARPAEAQAAAPN